MQGERKLGETRSIDLEHSDVGSRSGGKRKGAEPRGEGLYVKGGRDGYGSVSGGRGRGGEDGKDGAQQCWQLAREQGDREGVVGSRLGRRLIWSGKIEQNVGERGSV